MVGSNDDVMPGVLNQSQLTLEATAGQSYFVLVDGPDGASGDFVLSVSNGACGYQLTSLKDLADSTPSLSRSTFLTIMSGLPLQMRM